MNGWLIAWIAWSVFIIWKIAHDAAKPKHPTR